MATNDSAWICPPYLAGFFLRRAFFPLFGGCVFRLSATRSIQFPASLSRDALEAVLCSDFAILPHKNRQTFHRTATLKKRSCTMQSDRVYQSGWRVASHGVRGRHEKGEPVGAEEAKWMLQSGARRWQKC